MEKKRKLFVSFRYDDGNDIKEELIDELKALDLIIDKSEHVDRSDMSEEAIQEYLFKLLRDTSITVVLLTPKAINYKKNYYNQIDDWLYDELRYSLYDREDNSINGVIAVYTEDAKSTLVSSNNHICDVCNKNTSVTTIHQFENLVRHNMFNIKDKYKTHQCNDIYDSDHDHYISLVHIDEFLKSPKKYLDIAFKKRDRSDEFNLVKRLSK